MENTTGSVNIENAGYVQPEQPRYGFYQLCPKCDGEKEIPDNTISSVGNISLTRPCPICKGEGVIPRPEIKNMQP